MDGKNGRQLLLQQSGQAPMHVQANDLCAMAWNAPNMDSLGNAGNRVGESKLDQLSAAFLERSLPKAEWTHAAHLRVGLWHLLRSPPDEALARMRSGIRQYNVACGV